MPLAANVTLDATTWAALALVLTIFGATLSWVAWRRRGLAAGLRGLAWTLLPVAAWLTGTLRLAANILNAVLDWAARLVFSPVVWLGIVVAAVAAALWVVSGLMRTRGLGVRKGQAVRGSGTTPAAAVRGKPARSRIGSKGGRSRGDDIEDIDDIEAILKRHGI